MPLRTFVLILLVCGVMGLAAPSVLAQTDPSSTQPVSRGERARQLVEEGDRAMEAGQFEAAIDAYAASLKLRDDSEVWIKLGEAHHSCAYDAEMHIVQARRIWESVLSKNPRLLAVHRKLLGLWVEWTETGAGPVRTDALKRAIETSRQILQVSSGDRQARYTANWAIVELWLSREKIDARTLENATQELNAVWKEDPANADAAFAIARVQAMKAREFAARGDRTTAQHLNDDAIAIMDRAMRLRYNTAPAIFRKAQLLISIGPQLTGPATDVERKKAAADLNQEVFELADRARSLCPPEDKQYPQMSLFCSIMAGRLGKPEQSEAILRDLISKRPDNLDGRIQLAEQIRGDRARYAEALELVIHKRTGLPPPGVAGQTLRDTERRALMLAVDIRLDQLAVALEQNDSAVEQLRPIIDQDLKVLAAKLPDDRRVLRLVGKNQILSREFPAAVQSLEQALKLSPPAADRMKFDTMFLLARAYELTGRRDNAEQLLREMIHGTDYAPARVELARLLIARDALDEAQEQLNQLKQAAPDSPEVAKLEAALAEKRK